MRTADIEFTRAIAHIDGDAFFASCEQAAHPELKGKPVITGKERGIAASMSYEAKAMGVTRAMPLFEIRKLCPNVVILPSDYETYSLLSKRFFEIVRRYTPDVEEYGIDECFADLTNTPSALKYGYTATIEKLAKDLERELGFTFSIGLASNKVLAKVGSKWNKPNGITIITPSGTDTYLSKLLVEKLWGIGTQIGLLLNRLGIRTAFEFAKQPDYWVRSHLNKPYYEVWHELNNRSVLPLIFEAKTSYQSISKFKTFTPPSRDRSFVLAQLSRNIENACAKARRYKLAAQSVSIVLRTQQFRHSWREIEFLRATALPHEIHELTMAVFDEIFDPFQWYRATGVVLCDLITDTPYQTDLFTPPQQVAGLRLALGAVDALNAKYGKYTVHLGQSLIAKQFAQHLGDRGDAPQRKATIFKGETRRQRLNIPMMFVDI